MGVFNSTLKICNVMRNTVGEISEEQESRQLLNVFTARHILKNHSYCYFSRWGEIAIFSKREMNHTETVYRMQDYVNDNNK